MVSKIDPPSDSAAAITDDGDAPMPETASKAAPHYNVGYGNSPKATQWQKGQSGNPKGKKKGTKSLKELILAAAKKKVILKDAKGMKEVSQIEALIAFAFNHANKGNHKLVALLISLAEKFLPEPPPETKQDAIDKLNEAAKACPGYFVFTPNHVEALEGMRRLYGPGSDGGKR